MMFLGTDPDWSTRDDEDQTVSSGKKTIGGRGQRHACRRKESPTNRTHVWNADLRLGEWENSRQETLMLSV